MSRYYDEEEKKLDKAVKKDKDAAKTTAFEIDSAIHGLYSTKEGRQLLLWLLRIGKVSNQPFAANALITSFNCGELNVGLQVQARIIEVDSAGYVRLLQEQENDRRTQSKPSA